MPNDGSNPVGQQQGQEAERSGEDARRRGWFWHWNTIITQYAPLVGLKGVGLLNSYTVWTDRREESPHHGYAFPSQQSEADFYGEDRAELITINKILVTLGLIEIRKEMVLRIDERGRRWKVPHNLYRVRDHEDGYNLRTEDVLAVVQLAAKDRAVYRYIRRIFSPRFSPIDGDNVWHQMLPVLQQDPCWQQLAERALKEEARASARTKAGHANRSKSTNKPSNTSSNNGTRQEDDGERSVDSVRMNGRDEDANTSVDRANTGSGAGVEPTNRGSSVAADKSNSGDVPKGPTIADERNRGGQTDVAPGNTTYYEQSLTTTTTTETSDRGLPSRDDGAGPLPNASDAVVACFEAANNRDATPLEIQLLAELETRFEADAQGTGQTGAEWVISAIREAVGSGSRFVAPKRVKEILNRWSRERDRVRTDSAPAETPAGVTVVGASDVQLPGGRPGRDVWERALKRLSGVLDVEEMERLFERSEIVDYDAGTVTVRTATAEAAERLSGEYYELVSRKLAEAMRRSVRIEFIPAGPDDVPDEASSAGQRSDPSNVISFADANRPTPTPSFTLAGGLTNQQVWTSALERLGTRLTPATLETWLRPAALVGIDSDGALIIGAPNDFARRRIESRLREDVARVLGDLVGRPVTVRVVVTQEWLRRPGRDEESGANGD